MIKSVSTLESPAAAAPQVCAFDTFANVWLEKTEVLPNFFVYSVDA